VGVLAYQGEVCRCGVIEGGEDANADIYLDVVSDECNITNVFK